MADEKTGANGKSHHRNLTVVHETMLDGLSQLSDYFGFSKVMGQLYAVLLLSGEPLSLDEMMERLEISKASVSMNMRTLEHMGMVRQVWVRGRGGRRKYYEAETDFVQIMTNILSGREMRDVERALNVMQEDINLLSNTKDEMSEEDRKTAELYLERIAQMQTLFKFAQLVITSILTRVGSINLDDVSHIEIG